MNEIDEFKTALSHVRETRQLLDNVGSDRYDFSTLEEIGQRFNGLIGTFAFAKGKEGFCHILPLAEMIDAVVVHYKKEKETELLEEHLGFILEAVPFTIDLLQKLADGNTIETSDVDEVNRIIDLYMEQTEIAEKETLDQDEVDKLVG